jgi:hypothetical protein
MFILRRLFSGIRMNPELKATIEGLPDDAVIVYVSKTKSYFEFLCYYTRYMQAKLPYPQLGFDCSVRIWQPVGRLIRIAFAQVRTSCAIFPFKTHTAAGSSATRSTTAPPAFCRWWKNGIFIVASSNPRPIPSAI